jgi:predicted enzyme related to lactoylglutathione lyase
MNTIAYFEIQSSNPKKSADFYHAIFGWHCEIDPSIPIEYYRITTDGINGGILKRPVKTPPMEYGTNAFTCLIEVADFDATAKKIFDKGGKEALAKFAVTGKCWQGYFIDLDNNVFGIFQVDSAAK